MMTDTPSLGPCCNCGAPAIGIVMLRVRAPKPGTGWGCTVCELPMDGAVAVLCDGCAGQEPVTVCVGYPGTGARIPVDLCAEPFDHTKAEGEH